MHKVARLWLCAIALFAAVNTYAQIDPSNVIIARDQWGVPHIHGKTDADAVYGLAWAHSEDDFETIQEILLAVDSRLGEVKGKEGAILDFMNHILAVEELVDTAYYNLSEGARTLMESYAQGLNDYASAHPDEIMRKGVFPVSGQNITETYALTMAFLTNVYTDIQKIFSGYITNYEGNQATGSNAFAFNSNKTADGKAYLAVNSHQPLEGLFSWYEVHLSSDEGLNIMGGTFPGGALIFHGTNKHLGWAATLNHPDLSDVYKLTMHPDDKNKYLYDGEWYELEERKQRVKVKVLGFLRLPVKKKFYWSKYGTTIKSKHGYYSMRFPANMSIKYIDALYDLNKAKSLEDFRAAIDQQYFPGINLVYADRKDNIYFVSNGQFPYRNPNYDWTKVLPGDTSATLWEPEWHPINEIPQYLNPESGYLFNTNAQIFNATGPGDNLKPEDFEPTFGYTDYDNNRSIRAQALIGQYDEITYEDFKAIKYDRKMDTAFYTYAIENMSYLMEIDPEEHPKIADALEVIQDWNYGTEPDNMEAAMVVLTFNHLIGIIRDNATQYEKGTMPKEEFIVGVKKAKKQLKKHFGSLRVPLGEVQRHVRGDVSLPIGGGPDVIASNLSEPWKKGKLKTLVGESYIMLVQYSEEGVEIETVNAYGASNRPESDHYTDQMEMFVNQELKPMTLNWQKNLQQADEIYHPGGDAIPVEELIPTITDQDKEAQDQF